MFPYDATFSDVVLVAGNPPQWEYLQHGKWQARKAGLPLPHHQKVSCEIFAIPALDVFCRVRKGLPAGQRGGS